MSDSYPVIMELGSTANISLKAVSLPTGVTMYPETLYINVGETTTYFRLSATQDSAVGSYEFEWTITLEEVSDATFSPIKRTFFTVVEPTQQLINVEATPLVALEGTSKPLKIELSHPCDSSITLTINQVGTIPTLVTFTPSTVNFERGEQIKYYTVTIPAGSTGSAGEYSVVLTGTDAASYQLSESLFAFEVALKDVTPPVVVDFYTAEIARTSASFIMKVNEPVTLYYMSALGGTLSATSDEIKAGQLSEAKLEDLFQAPKVGFTKDAVTNEDGTYTYEFTVTGLAAQTPNKIQTYIEDLGGNSPSENKELTFYTSDRYNSATFNLKLWTEELTDVVEAEIIRYVSEVLRIKEDRVLIRKNYYEKSKTTSNFGKATPTFTTTSGGRQTQATIFVDVIILPDPTDASDNSPVKLANSLYDYKHELKALFPIYDETYAITASEIIGPDPGFIYTPFLASVVNEQVTISNTQLIDDGTMYVCVILAAATEVSPSSWQVFRGLNANNYPCDATDSRINPPTGWQSRIGGLKANTEYYAYVTATNNVEGYPDLLADTEVVSLKFTTTPDTDDSDFAVTGIIAFFALLIV